MVVCGIEQGFAQILVTRLEKVSPRNADTSTVGPVKLLSLCPSVCDKSKKHRPTVDTDQSLYFYDTNNGCGYDFDLEFQSIKVSNPSFFKKPTSVDFSFIVLSSFKRLRNAKKGPI